MKYSRTDLEMFAARIRPHFEPELRDTAYRLALEIALTVGDKVKDLRPETRLDEITLWLGGAELGIDSLDSIELVMALEEESELWNRDKPAMTSPVTFRDLVILRARKRVA